jgi:cytochrome c-type biogenesis protein CcmE
MSRTTWTTKDEMGQTLDRPHSRWKLWFVAILLLAASGWLVWNSLGSGGTQLYKTVDEFAADPDRLVGSQLRLAGWVDGATISYQQLDSSHSRLEFDITSEQNGLGHRIHVVLLNEPKPDLLQAGAQALVDGTALSAAEFSANPGGLLLKCPTRYEPQTAETNA